MKLLITKTAVCACAIAISLGAIQAHAQNSSNPLRERAEARMEVKVQNRSEIVPALNADSEIKVRVTNQESKSSLRAEVTNKRPQNSIIKRDIRASSTMMFKRATSTRNEVVSKMHLRNFENRKAALVEQLNIALRNMENISVRIEERIAKIGEAGRSTTDAEAAFEVAIKKLADAKISVNTLASFSPSTVQSGATTTVEVDLAKPREIGDAAITAAKEARKAFVQVLTFMKMTKPSPSATVDVDAESSIE